MRSGLAAMPKRSFLSPEEATGLVWRERQIGKDSAPCWAGDKARTLLGCPNRR